MTSKYEVENLLREPVEIYSAAAATAGSALCFAAPEIFMISKYVAWSTGGYLALNGLIRAHQATKVIQYQKGMKRLNVYVLSSNEIPVKQNFLFLGIGFEWRAKHTERLYAARDSKNERFVRRGRLYYYFRKLEPRLDSTRYEWFAKMTKSQSLLNPFRPDPPVGGSSAIHGVGRDEESEQFLPIKDRSGHHAVIGSTDTGKTRKAEIYITQDIRRGNNVVFVIDPKGDADLFKRTYIEAVRAGRENEFYCFHLGFPEFSVAYNPVGSFSRVTEIPTRLTSNLPDTGDSKAFKDFAWQFSHFISSAEVDLGRKPTYKSLKKHIRRIDGLFVDYALHVFRKKNIDFESAVEANIADQKHNPSRKGKDKRATAIARFIRDNDIEDTKLEDLLYMFELDRDYYSKIVIQIGPFLEKVTSGKIGDILSPDYKANPGRKTLDIPEAFKRGAVVYIGLDAMTDPEVAEATGEALFSEMTAYAGYIYKHGIDSDHPYADNNAAPVFANIHGDEFSDLIGKKFANMINKSRGAGYQLTLYTQTVSDIIDKLGSDAAAGKVTGNINTIEMLRVQEPATAELITSKLHEIKIRESTSISGYQDQQDSLAFIANKQDRTTEASKDMLQPADLVALPKGQSFVLTQGNNLYKLRSPLPSKDDDSDMPSDIKELFVKMKESYRTGVALGNVANA